MGIEFSLFEYFVELLIEYSSTRLIPEVDVNYRVVRNKRILGFSFKSACTQRFETLK